MYAFAYVVESLRTFSPGLLALDLALSTPLPHYPRPRVRCVIRYRGLARGVVRSGLVCIGKIFGQRRRVVGNEMKAVGARGPGRGALGRWPAGHRLDKKTRLKLLGGKSVDFRLQNLFRLLSISQSSINWSCGQAQTHRLLDARPLRTAHASAMN